jgi:DNA polymerase-4
MEAGAHILHVDLDAFYATVEGLKRPELQGKPFAVGGGVVLSASYEARAHGVRSGMPTGKARQICPRLIVVSGRFSSYGAISDGVFEICRRFTPLVEQVSIDEAFLDVSGAHHLFGSTGAIAEDLRRAVRAETGLVLSAGGARTKFLAKVASQVAKPDGVVVVEPEYELRFLHKLGVRYLWGAGPVMQDKLAALGLHTIGQVAEASLESLESRLGRGAARHLHALAWNRDPRLLQMTHRARSVGSQSTFGQDVRDEATYRRVLANIADRVGARLRAKHRAGRTITVRVRFADFDSITRSTTLRAPVASSGALYAVATELLRRGLEVAEGRGVRLLGISVSGIQVDPHVQLELPLGFAEAADVARAGSARDRERTELDTSIDQLRERFGKDAVANASVLLDPRRGRDGLSELMTRNR